LRIIEEKPGLTLKIKPNLDQEFFFCKLRREKNLNENEHKHGYKLKEVIIGMMKDNKMLISKPHDSFSKKNHKTKSSSAYVSWKFLFLMEKNFAHLNLFLGLNLSFDAVLFWSWKVDEEFWVIETACTSLKKSFNSFSHWLLFFGMWFNERRKSQIDFCPSLSKMEWKKLLRKKKKCFEIWRQLQLLDVLCTGDEWTALG